MRGMQQLRHMSSAHPAECAGTDSVLSNILADRSDTAATCEGVGKTPVVMRGKQKLILVRLCPGHMLAHYQLTHGCVPHMVILSLLNSYSSHLYQCMPVQ